MFVYFPVKCTIVQPAQWRLCLSVFVFQCWREEREKTLNRYVRNLRGKERVDGENITNTGALGGREKHSCEMISAVFVIRLMCTSLCVFTVYECIGKCACTVELNGSEYVEKCLCMYVCVSVCLSACDYCISWLKFLNTHTVRV